jgi:hypothetical protein
VIATAVSIAAQTWRLMQAPVAPDFVTVFITHLGMECREDTGFDHAGDVACQVKLVRCVESG